MGTSTSNPGQKGSTPLVPSWLNEGGQDAPVLPNALPVDPQRFKVPRSNFSRYANSGGNDSSSFHRATSQYVKQALGGAHNATIRLGAARISTVNLVNILNSVSRNGVAATSKQYDLGDLIGKSANEVFLRIMTFVCPDGGSTDEGIARSSYIETMISSPDLQQRTFESLTDVEFLIFTQTFISNIIFERLLNDIGNRVVTLPQSIAQVEEIQSQAKSYIAGAVSDAIYSLNVDIKNVGSSQTTQIVDSVYEKAYTILSEMEGV